MTGNASGVNTEKGQGSPMPEIAAIVMAAGQSSRMPGINKLLLPFGASTVLRKTLMQLAGAGISNIVVVTGRDVSKVEDSAQRIITSGESPTPQPDIQFVFNKFYEQGMTSSIQAGVAVANADAFMIVLGDMPLVNSAEYADMVLAFGNAWRKDPQAILLPAFKGQRGNPVIFSAWYREVILQQPPGEGCRQLVRDFQEHVTEIEFISPHILDDIDTPADLDRLSGLV